MYIYTHTHTHTHTHTRYVTRLGLTQHSRIVDSLKKKKKKELLILVLYEPIQMISK